MKRNICVITGSRSEYGLLYWLMKEIRADKKLRLQLIATGMHLSPEFGLTYKLIEKDGFIINEKVEMLLSSDTPEGITKSMGLAMIGFAETYRRLKPDIVVVMGDRFEIFASVAAAMVARIPVAHLNGGELTEGAIDDPIRHSITKMAHLHFTATDEYGKRVIQLGEDPRRVFVVGEIGLDNIKRLKLLSKEELERSIRFKFGIKNILVTFHPVTLEKATAARQFSELLHAIDDMGDIRVIFTKPNADTDGRVIARMIDEYVRKNNTKAAAFLSLGSVRYLSALKYVDAVVGNSSSGIVEAPSFKIGTINIGDRQAGRVKAESVIDCKPSRKDIKKAFGKIYSKDFQKILREVKNPYEAAGYSSREVKNILKHCDLKNIIKKRFYDIGSLS